MLEHPSSEPISPELRERLVAYLDGELDADEARQVEQLIARDPRIENELRQLERTWRLLDRLPRAEVDPSFTQSTVEMVALAVEDELRPTRVRRTGRGAGWGAVLIVACLAGFVGARLWPNANRQLLWDLPIIEALEAYRQTPQIDFLRELAKQGIFADETTVAGGDHSLIDRRKRLDALSTDQKDELHRKYERFVRLPADEQQRLRKLAAAVDDDGERALLETTLARYQHWLEQLPGVERAELIAMESAQRLQRIKRMRRDEGRRLSAEDLQQFVGWFTDIVPKLLPPPEREAVQRELSRASEEERPAIVRRALAKLRPPVNAGRPSTMPRRPPGKGPLVDPQALAQLGERLSPHGQQMLSEAHSDVERRTLVWSWVNQAFAQPHAGRGNLLSLPEVDEDELRSFFQHDLSPEQRAQLLNLPADQMRRQLLLRYHAKRAAQ
jgi:hypothetical protein